MTDYAYIQYQEALSTLPLPPRQERVLRSIEASLARRGYVPTLQAMAQAMGSASLQGVKDPVAAVERKGYVRRFPGRRRALAGLHPLGPRDGSLPILGRVAAGRPLVAVAQQAGFLRRGAALLGIGTPCAVRVQGESRSDAGIQAGDYVIVRQQDTADPGDIVVVLLGDAGTGKRLRKKGAVLLLEAANAAYAPIPLTRQSPSPRISGTVVGLIGGLAERACLAAAVLEGGQLCLPPEERQRVRKGSHRTLLMKALPRELTTVPLHKTP